MVWMTPSKFVMRPPWDGKRSASSDFTSLEQKKVHRGGIWWIGMLTDRLFAFAAIYCNFPEWGCSEVWVITVSQKLALGLQYGTFSLENQPGHGQSLLDGSCIDGFATGLSKHRWRHQPQCCRSFMSFWFFWVFNSIDDIICLNDWQGLDPMFSISSFILADVFQSWRVRRWSSASLPYPRLEGSWYKRHFDWLWRLNSRL